VKLRKIILVADGQALIRSGLKNWLNEYNEYLVYEAESIEVLQSALIKTECNIVILDHLTLFDFTPSTLQILQAQFQKTSFIVISGDNDDSSILRILSAGISGYLTKNCSQKEIMQAILAVSRGEKFFCAKVINLLIHVRTKNDDEKGDHQLTDRETEIVKLIAEGNSTMQIASVLNLSHHTINSHRKNILRKLKIKSPVELVVYAINTGLIMPK
jgi:DNA-binding NarL/FixJ family response regulator